MLWGGDEKSWRPNMRAVYVVGCLVTFLMVMAAYASGLGWIQENYGSIAIAGVDLALIGVALALIYRDRRLAARSRHPDGRN